MKVRAKSFGFADGSRRRPGAVFDWPDNKPLGGWMELVDAPSIPLPQETARQEHRKIIEAANPPGGRKPFSVLKEATRGELMTYVSRELNASVDVRMKREDLLNVIKDIQGES